LNRLTFVGIWLVPQRAFKTLKIKFFCSSILQHAHTIEIFRYIRDPCRS